LKKNIFISLIIFSFLTSCVLEKDLDGLWIGAYSEDKSLEDYHSSTIQKVVKFDDSNYKIYGVEKMYGKNQEGEFRMLFGKLNFDFDNYVNYRIVNINEDSLVLNLPNNKYLIEVFKKIPNEFKIDQSKKIELIGNSYTLKHDFGIDTLYFKSDSIVVRTNKYRKASKYYQRYNLDGFNILLIDDFDEIPLILTDINSGNIDVMAFHKKRYKWKLILE